MELIDGVCSDGRVDSMVGKGLLIVEAVSYVLSPSKSPNHPKSLSAPSSFDPLMHAVFNRCILLLATSLSALSVPHSCADISVALSAGRSQQGYLLASLVSYEYVRMLNDVICGHGKEACKGARLQHRLAIWKDLRSPLRSSGEAGGSNVKDGKDKPRKFTMFFAQVAHVYGVLGYL